MEIVVNVMTKVASKSCTILKEDKIESRPLKNQMVMELQRNNEIIVLITMHRILITLQNGLYYLLRQYNLSDGEVKSITTCRKEKLD